MKMILVSVCSCPSSQTSSAKHIQTEQRRWQSTFFAITLSLGLQLFFCKDLKNPQSILSLYLFRFFQNFASTGCMSGYNYSWVCVCVNATSVLTVCKIPKNRPCLKSFHIFNDMTRTTWLPPTCPFV